MLVGDTHKECFEIMYRNLEKWIICVSVTNDLCV